MRGKLFPNHVLTCSMARQREHVYCVTLWKRYSRQNQPTAMSAITRTTKRIRRRIRNAKMYDFNAKDHRPRACDVRVETATRSRGFGAPAGSAIKVSTVPNSP